MRKKAGCLLRESEGEASVDGAVTFAGCTPDGVGVVQDAAEDSRLLQLSETPNENVDLNYSSLRLHSNTSRGAMGVSQFSFPPLEAKISTQTAPPDYAAKLFSATPPLGTRIQYATTVQNASWTNI